jgi:curli biogenesis system outer membrane secretion channel CsgG
MTVMHRVSGLIVAAVCILISSGCPRAATTAAAMPTAAPAVYAAAQSAPDGPPWGPQSG